MLNYIDENKIREKNVVVFGINKFGEKCFELLKERNINVKYFIDDNTKLGDETFLGIKVLSVKELLKLNREETVIFLCKGDEEKEYLLDGCYLRYFNFNNIIFMSRDSRVDNIINNIENINNVFKILSDNKSKKTLYNILKYRVTKIDDCLLSIYDENQYFPQKDIFQFSED